MKFSTDNGRRIDNRTQNTAIKNAVRWQVEQLENRLLLTTTDPVIFNVNDATPGTVIGIQGDNFTNGSQIFVDRVPDTEASGLVSAWRFEEGDGTKAFDTSTAGSWSDTGTLTNGPTYVSGKIGTGLKFNGSTQYVQVPAYADTQPTAAVTVAAWAKSGGATWNATGTFVSTANAYALYPVAGSKEIRFAITTGGTTVFATFTPTFDITQWHHYAGVWNGSTIQLYVDGVASGSSVAKTGTMAAATNLRLGRDQGTAYLAGTLDEVRIYNAALNGTNVAALKNVPNASTQKQAQVVSPAQGPDYAYLAGVVPAGLAEGQYATFVRNPGVSSNVDGPAKLINTAQVWETLDLADTLIAPNITFRLYGQNLEYATTTSKVWFTDTTTGAILSATVTNTADPYYLTITSPAGLVAGRAYDIFVSNGYGGSYGVIKALTMTARAGGADPYNLGTSWASDFSSTPTIYNVTTYGAVPNDSSSATATANAIAIQAAIDAAYAAGGGVVYFPQGAGATVNTYYVFRDNAACILLKSNVVLKGDGKNGSGQWTSVISQTSTTSADNSRMVIGTFTSGRTKMGITGLYVFAPGNGDNITLHMTGVNELFVTNSRIDSTRQTPIYFAGGSNKGIFKDSEFNQLSILYYSNNKYTLYNLGSSDVIYKNNLVTWHYGRLDFTTGRRMTLEGNTFSRSNISPPTQPNGSPPINYGGPSIGGSDNSVIINNTFDKLENNSTPIEQHNDGETILNESGGGQIMRKATTWSDNTIGDSGTAWTGSASFVGMAVMITQGTGSGQVRTIASYTSNSLTTTQPWDVNPDATSYFSIVELDQEILIKGNTLSNVPRGIWMYGAPIRDLAIVGNTLTDAEGISIRSGSVQFVTRERFQPVINARVESNTITDTLGLYPAQLTVHAQRNDGTEQWGNGFLNFVVRKNTVTGLTPTNVTIPNNGNGDQGEGYHVNSFMPVASVDNDTPGSVGVILEGNKAVNTDYAYHLSSGTSQVIIWNPTESGNNRARFSNQQITGYDGAAKRSVFGFANGQPMDIPMSRFYSQDIGTLTPNTPSSSAMISTDQNEVGYDIAVNGNTTISGANDKFEFNYLQVTGDFDIKARVAGFDSVYDANSATLAGLMIRESLTTNSRHAMISAATDSTVGYRFVSRSTTGGGTTATGTGTAVSYPNTWMRLTRVGNLFTGYRSTDGTTWAAVGTAVTIALPSTAYLGLAASTNVYNRVMVAQFRNVSITGGGYTPLNASDAVQFRDDFFHNGSVWNNLGASSGNGSIGTDPVTGRSAWLPAVDSDGGAVTSTATLPTPLNVVEGPISVYMRVRVDATSAMDANRFSITLGEQTPNSRFASLVIRPGTASQISYSDSSGVTQTASITGYTFANTTTPVDFRLTLTNNGNGSMALSAAYYDTTTSAWVSLGSVASADINSGLFNVLSIYSRNSTASTNRAYFDSVNVSQNTGGLFAKGANETVAFTDNFATGANGWTGMGPATTQATAGPDAVTGRGVWAPSVNSDNGQVTSTYALPQGLNIANGMISVYARVRVDDINNVDSNRFQITLTEQSPNNRYGSMTVRPGNTSNLGYRNSAGTATSATTSSYTFPNTTDFVDFKLTLTNNGGGSMTLNGYYYNASTGAWVSLGSFGSADIDSGIFSSLSIFSRNASGGSNRVYFDSVLVTQELA